MVETLYQISPAPAPLPNESPEAWFHAIETPPEKPKIPWKHIAIIVGVVMSLGSAVVLLVLVNPSTCLNAADYKALTGITYTDGDITPKDNFYTYTIDFAAGSGTYDISAEPTGQNIIDDIGAFYKSHNTKSILLSIDSPYILSKDTPLAKQRIATIKSDLIKNGIPESTIKTAEPSHIDSESETEIATTATIAITSAATCK